MLAVADAGSATGVGVGVAVAAPPPPRGTVDEPLLHPAASRAQSSTAAAGEQNAYAARFRTRFDSVVPYWASVRWRVAAR